MMRRSPNRTLLGFVVLASLVGAGCADIVSDVFDYGVVDVTTLRRNGDPVPGAEVTLFNDIQVMARGHTNEQGTYRFEFVAPRPYGVRGEPPEGYTRPENVVGGPSTAFKDGFVMEEGGSGSVAFTYVKEGPGRIRVRVSRGDGTAVEDGLVYVYGPGGVLASDSLDSSGEILFDPVSFGNRGVGVEPPLRYLDHGERTFEESGLLIEEDWTEEVSFVLEPCVGTIRGVVEDPSGGPVSGFPLVLFGPQEVVESRQTDAQGEAVFGPFSCRAFLESFGLALEPRLGWVFETGRGQDFYDGIRVTRDAVTSRTFTVEACSPDIHVGVREDGGDPIQGVPVLLFTSEGLLEERVSDSGGSLVFPAVPCGREYGLRVLPGIGFTVEEGRGTSFYDGIVLSPGPGPSFTFVLDRCSAPVEVLVTDESGAPVPGADLHLFTSTATWASATTGADGRWTFSDVPCGQEYGVKVSPPGGYTVEEGRGSSFFDGLVLEDGVPVDVVFRLTKTTP